MVSIEKQNKRYLIWFLIGVGIALIPIFVLAQEAAVPKKEKFHFYKEAEDAYGYTQCVKVGNTIYVSGVTGRGDMAGSIQSVYERIGKALAAYGADFRHVVKENLFTTDIEAVKANKDVRLKFYKGDHPAATWIQIDRLFMPDYNLEVEVMAVIGEK